MKKRSLLLLTCILLLAVFTLASCGNKDDNTPPHNHTYDTTKYVSNESSHWYGASCEHTDLRLQVANHADADDNGVCDVCEYVTCTHEYNDDEWLRSEEEHWHAATCGCEVTKDNAAHSDENKDGICDVCEYVTCTHELSEEWSSNEEGHWNVYVCGCELTPTVSEHKDTNKDGICDVCEYVTCEHNPEEAWSYNAYTHWHATDCGCEVRIDEAAHKYTEDSSICTVCGKSCEHPAKEEWSYDADGHWHDAACGHEGYTYSNNSHIDKNSDGMCDVCGYENTVHVHTFELSYNKSQHYSLSTCGHLIAQDFENHTDEDENSYCDECVAYLGDLVDIVDSATSEEAAAKVSGGSWSENLSDYITNYTYSYYAGHMVYSNGSYTNYLSSFSLNGVPTLLKVVVDSKGNQSLVSDADIAELQGQYMDIMYGAISGYGLESFIYEIYNFANGGANVVYDYVEYYDPTTNTVGFSFAYEEVSEWSGNSLYDFSVVFTTVNGAIKTATIKALTFYDGNYILDKENNVCITIDSSMKIPDNNTEDVPGRESDINTLADTYNVYVFTQSIGERVEQENPYSAENILITDLIIYNSATGEQIKDGDTVEISVGPNNALVITLPEGDVDKAALNSLNVSCNSHYVVANSFNYPYRVYTMNRAGDFTVTVSSYAGGSISFTLHVNKIAPGSLSSAVVDDNGNKTGASSVQSFVGVPVEIGAIADSDAGSTNVAVSVTGGDPNAVTFVADGDNWLVSASKIGTYTITLTSTMDSSVSTSITLVAITPPTPAELLLGNYILETEDGTIITVKLIPDYEGALTGTVKIAYDNNAFQNRLVINEIATYVYADGVITLTHSDGDGLENIGALVITDRYEVALVVLPYGSAMDQSVEYVLVKGPDDPNGTEKAPFVLNDSADIDVDLEAGEYVYYTFTPAAKGTLTVSILGEFADWDISYGTVDFVTSMTSVFTSGTVIDVVADTTIYIKIGTYSGDAASFSLSLVYEKAPIVAPTLENLAGTWEGTESNSGIFKGQTFNITLVLNADGTGTGTHSITDIGTFNVTDIAIDGMNVTITTDASGTDNKVLYLTYSDGILSIISGNMGMMFGTSVEIAKTVSEDGDDGNDGNQSEVINAVWSTDITSPTAITASGTYSITVEAGSKGYFSIDNEVLGDASVSITVSIDNGVLYECHPLRGDTALPVTSVSQTIDSVTDLLIFAVGGTDGAAVITVTITLA